jgi:prolyl-tRNA synthetase
MLGTGYAESIGARYLDAEGKEHPIIMGSYGVGITRTAQAALEKYFDDKGMIWPVRIAPYGVELIPISIANRAHVEAAERIYAELNAAGIEVLMDDRDERPGVKFNDADLIGLPIRITIGDKSLKEGKVEVKARSSKETVLVPFSDLVGHVRGLLEELN